PRDRVDREGTLLPGVVEGDALVEVAAGQRLRTGAELLEPEPGQRVVQRAVGGPHRPVGREHLVASGTGAGAVEQRGGRHVYHSHTTPDPVCPGPMKWPGPTRKRAPCPCSPGSCAPRRAHPRSVAGCATSGAPRSGR